MRRRRPDPKSHGIAASDLTAINAASGKAVQTYRRSERAAANMTMIALINLVASGVGPGGVKRMQQALAAFDADADVVIFDATCPAAQLRELAARNPKALIVWGGDGTHRSALSTVGRLPSRLVLLPGGTKNFLSRSLHGSAQWEDILKAVLKSPVERIVPAGEIGDERFYCAALAGAPARMAQAREDFRHGDFGKAVNDLGVALSEINDLRLAVRYKDKMRPELTLPRTNLAAALVGPLSMYSHLEIAVLPDPSLMTTLDATWSSFNSGFRELHGMTTASAEVIEIENEADEDIPVIVDGEQLNAGRRIRIRFVEQGGYCLAAG